MLNPSHSIHWQDAPMPADAVPLGTGPSLRLGRPWKWAVRDGQESGTKVFLGFDSRKQEYRIWQFRERDGLLLRVEYHGHAPGWHAHSAFDQAGALTAARQDISATRFPLLENTDLWKESAHDRLRALFPYESMGEAQRAAIADRVQDLSPRTQVHAVPFGAAVGLPGETAHGDSLGFYVAQLGRRTPLFRLEDDGTVLPVLEAAGAVAVANRIDIRAILAETAVRGYYFGPDNRALFTPFFPLDELLDRAKHFVATMRALWAHLQDGPATSAPTPVAL